MKQRLKSLYSNHLPAFKALRETFLEDLPGPFLISPNLLYTKQKHKLLIIGQQTKGWTYDLDVDKQISNYELFNVGENYYASPFWNVTRKLEKSIGNDPFSCAWTNINKFDLDEDRPYGEIETAISKLDNIIIDEIKITNPDICMFFTGPDFDCRLRNIFPNIEMIEINGWKTRQFCQLKHKDLPKHSYRSYHPKSLRIRRLEDKFIDELTDRISTVN